MPIYPVTLTDEEVSILKDSIFDIQEWLDLAIAGKVNNAKRRMLQRNPQLGGTEDERVSAIFADPEYKDRAQREPEGKYDTTPPQG